MNKDFAIDFKNVSKVFGKKQILNNVNFSVSKGSFHVLIGENGAGKTTIIRTMLNLYQEKDGAVKLNGVDNALPESHDGICYISETPLFPHYFSAYEYLVWMAKLFGKMNDQGARAEVNKLMAEFDVERLKNTNPNKCSSGEKKKILLMQVLLQKPNLIILDEPAANLDPTARDFLFNKIKKLNDNGTTIFICSHVLDEVDKYADETTIISGGTVKYSGPKGYQTLSEIFKEHAYTEKRVSDD